MIYSTNCSKYTNIVRRSSAIGFAVLTTSGFSSGPLKSCIRQRHLQRRDVKVFLVETEAMSWYMDVYAATPEQCSNTYQQKHLCVVACQHESSRTLHAVSQILFGPQIHPHRYSHLTQLDCLLRKHPVLAKAVGAAGEQQGNWGSIQGMQRRSGWWWRIVYRVYSWDPKMALVSMDPHDRWSF